MLGSWLGGGRQLGSRFCGHFDMGFCWVIKTKTNPNSTSVSSSSLDKDDPSLDKASSSSEEINVSIRFVLGNLIYNRVVFGLEVPTQLIIGSSSCYTCLCNRVSRVDPNWTRLPQIANPSDI
jgi:hypothetical protein